MKLAMSMLVVIGCFLCCGCQTASSRVAPPGTGSYQVPTNYYGNTNTSQQATMGMNDARTAVANAGYQGSIGEMDSNSVVGAAFQREISDASQLSSVPEERPNLRWR
ncbi:MAG: hypothetical protein KDB03_12990 [Planctomycetales bacterium]|nr:hypothetical protein [Planctomycetales bacterium]